MSCSSNFLNSYLARQDDVSDNLRLHIKLFDPDQSIQSHVFAPLISLMMRTTVPPVSNTVVESEFDALPGWAFRDRR